MGIEQAPQAREKGPDFPGQFEQCQSTEQVCTAFDHLAQEKENRQKEGKEEKEEKKKTKKETLPEEKVWPNWPMYAQQEQTKKTNG